MDLIMNTCAQVVGKEVTFCINGERYIGVVEVINMATGHLKLRTNDSKQMIVRSDRIDLIILELPNGKPTQV